MNIQARKQELRQRIIAARDNLTPNLRAHASQQIVESLCGLASYKTARTVLGYMSFGSELTAELWVQQALNDGKQVVLPRVNQTYKQLDLYRVRELKQDVAPGLWGIPEPVIGRCNLYEALGDIDFILMPGVAFTRNGARLGYGGGFFDKLLARLPGQPALVAGAFALQIIEVIPQEDTDRKVAWVVTENETINCAGDTTR